MKYIHIVQIAFGFGLIAVFYNRSLLKEMLFFDYIIFSGFLLVVEAFNRLIDS